MPQSAPIALHHGVQAPGRVTCSMLLCVLQAAADWQPQPLLASPGRIGSMPRKGIGRKGLPCGGSMRGPKPGCMLTGATWKGALLAAGSPKCACGAPEPLTGGGMCAGCPCSAPLCPAGTSPATPKDEAGCCASASEDASCSGAAAAGSAAGVCWVASSASRLTMSCRTARGEP